MSVSENVVKKEDEKNWKRYYYEHLCAFLIQLFLLKGEPNNWSIKDKMRK